MRIGIVTQWFPPEGATMIESWAIELDKLGHEVHVVTGFPNYPTGVVFDGYKVGVHKKETLGAITIHRAFLYPSHDANPVRRFANYASFALGASYVANRIPRVDVWLTNCTPITAAIPASLQRRFRNTPTVTIIQDLWPDSVLESGFLSGGVGRRARPMIEALCQFVYRNSDVVGIISPGMRKILEDRGVPGNRIHYMPNGVADRFMTMSKSEVQEFKRDVGLPEGRIFMYAGNLGPLQNLSPLIEAFRSVPEANLVIAGSGVCEAELRRLSEGAANISFVGRVSRDAFEPYRAASDVQIVSLADTALLRVTMPSKLQAALGAGKPILAHAPGDVSKLISAGGSGISVEPLTVSSATRVIANMVDMSDRELEDMGSRARALYDASYSVGAMARRLEAALASAVRARS